jgi:DNA-binding transcriptional LysR family regulator
MTTSRLHSLDIRLLRYFAVVAEENNISRAAQRLFISQPPLSRHIRHLETQLGVTLFQRHTKGLILTDEGERVLEMIRPLLALQERTLARWVSSPTTASSLASGADDRLRTGHFRRSGICAERKVSALSSFATLHRRWLSRCAKANSMRRWLRCR